MRVVRQTSTQLTLRYYPWKVWLISLLMITVGLIILHSGRVVTLTCNRVEPSEGLCALTSQGIWESTSTEFPTSLLQGAVVDQHQHVDRDDEGRESYKYSYRVVLLTRRGEIPFTSYYTSSGYRQKTVIVHRINDFVRFPDQTSLIVQQDDRWFAYLLGGILTFAGLISALGFGQLITCHFDKTLDQVVIKQQGLFTTQTVKQSVQAIAGVRLSTYTTPNGKPVDRIVLDLNSGGTVPLTTYYGSGITNNRQAERAIAEFLREIKLQRAPIKP